MTTPIYTNNYRSNLTKFWQQYYPNWTIPNGYHVHHIKPKSTFSDPNDPRIHHPKNLITLHPDDHASIHKCRGDKYLSNNFITSIVGRKDSIETRIKKSISTSGENHPQWGIPCSQSVKNKISKSLKLLKRNGNKNSNFKGYYIFNGIKYDTKLKLAKYLTIGITQVDSYCKSNNDKICNVIIYGKSKFIQSLGKKSDIVGRTFKELGFSFENN